MKLIAHYQQPHITSDELADYGTRNAARGFVFDEHNNVGILHARAKNYYDLPGGGVEAGETLEEAFIREIKEGLGCNITDIRPIGKTIEVRDHVEYYNVTHWFTAKLSGPKGDPDLQPDEIEDDLHIDWLPLPIAREKIASPIKATEYYHQWIQDRALAAIDELEKQLT